MDKIDLGKKLERNQLDGKIEKVEKETLIIEHMSRDGVDYKVAVASLWEKSPDTYPNCIDLFHAHFVDKGHFFVCVFGRVQSDTIIGGSAFGLLV